MLLGRSWVRPAAPIGVQPVRPFFIAPNFHQHEACPLIPWVLLNFFVFRLFRKISFAVDKKIISAVNNENPRRCSYPADCLVIRDEWTTFKRLLTLVSARKLKNICHNLLDMKKKLFSDKLLAFTSLTVSWLFQPFSFFARSRSIF